MAVSSKRWRPWPRSPARKLEVSLVVRRAEGVPAEGDGATAVVTAEITWKGAAKAGLASSLRRGVRRNCTRREEVVEGGVVVWNEEFKCVCGMASRKGGVLQPWEITFSVFNDTKATRKQKASVIGAATLNLMEHPLAFNGEIDICLQLLPPGSSSEIHSTLHLSLSLLELRTSQDQPTESLRRCIPPFTSSPCRYTSSSDNDEPSIAKSGSKKVSILASLVSTRKYKKTGTDGETSEGKSPNRNDVVGEGKSSPRCADSTVAEEEESKEGQSFRKSLSYGTLASANHIGCSAYCDMVMNREYEDWVYYSQRISDFGSASQVKDTSSVPAAAELAYVQSSNWILLPWRKKNKPPKDRGEPLLKKGNGEEGGDDIDYDRRQLSSSNESISTGSRIREDEGSAHSASLSSEFGDDNFVVGRWESKDIVSRDGRMKLSAQVFFASIDQRSERAAGESACTALVAVIADWFQVNQDTMPIKSQFDNLIREGSLEWRKLCENQSYLERFPDKHFDLDTVVQARIRPLAVDQGKSFIGFFQPEVSEESGGGFDFLNGAMSFDNIWEEISQAATSIGIGSSSSPTLYIVSWNDHFFLLKVEHGAYYIIDTLGERLTEGCDQAFILKFDESTVISREKPDGGGETAVSESQREKTNTTTKNSDVEEQGKHSDNGLIAAAAASEDEGIVCRGKESCKEYIKSFLAAIPIRELQADIKRGLMASIPLHHRLQIEFHYTESCKDIAVATTAPSTPSVSETASVYSWPEEAEGGREVTAAPSYTLEMEDDGSVFSWAKEEHEVDKEVDATVKFLTATPSNLGVEVM